MNGKSFSLPEGAILDLCENAFHFLFLHKITILGNVPLYPELTVIDNIWHEYCYIYQSGGIKQYPQTQIYPENQKE